MRGQGGLQHLSPTQWGQESRQKFNYFGKRNRDKRRGERKICQCKLCQKIAPQLLYSAQNGGSVNVS